MDGLKLIECLSRMQISVVVLPLLGSPHSRGDAVMQRKKEVVFKRVKTTVSWSIEEIDAVL